MKISSLLPFTQFFAPLLLVSPAHGIDSSCKTVYASEVIDYKPGKTKGGDDIIITRKNPANALGDAAAPPYPVPAQYVTLGFGGEITLKMSAPIQDNGASSPFSIEEYTVGTLAGCDNSPERAQVFASQDGELWKDVGVLCQDGNAQSLQRLAWAQYVKIKDISDVNDSRFTSTSDGYDVDGIIGNSCGTSSFCAMPTYPDQYTSYAVWGFGFSFGSDPKLGFFVPDKLYFERNDVAGTARLSGSAHRYLIGSSTHDYDATIVVDINMTGLTKTGTPNPGTLNPYAFSTFTPAGPVDTSTFEYYPSYTGSISGGGKLAGMNLSLESAEPFQVGYGASGFNVERGGSGSANYTVNFQPANEEEAIKAPEGSQRVGLHVDFVTCRERCVNPPIFSGEGTQPTTTISSAAAFDIPSVASDLYFVPFPGKLVEYVDGYFKGLAHLTGEVRSASNPASGFSVDTNLGCGSNNTPLQEPVKGLEASLYSTIGGIDPADWRFYGCRSKSSLTGDGDFTGTTIDFTSVSQPIQIGRGANGITTDQEGGYGVLNTTSGQVPVAFSVTEDSDCEVASLSFPTPTPTPTPTVTPQPTSVPEPTATPGVTGTDSCVVTSTVVTINAVSSAQGESKRIFDGALALFKKNLRKKQHIALAGRYAKDGDTINTNFTEALASYDAVQYSACADTSCVVVNLTPRNDLVLGKAKEFYQLSRSILNDVVGRAKTRSARNRARGLLIGARRSHNKTVASLSGLPKTQSNCNAV